MIVVKLMGGMGNQMFQYAAAKSLSIKHNTVLKLDLSFLQADSKGLHTQRNLELDAFHANYELYSQEELKKISQTSFFKKHFPFLFKYSVANEQGFQFNENFFSLPNNVYLNGFWQSEKYFQNIREILLKEFTLKHPLPENCQRIEDVIRQNNSVSLHIRRGDYVSNKNANIHHGVLPLDYYYKALAHLNKNFSDIKVFIFSDDIAWTKANMKVENAHKFIDTNNSPAIDLYLMSLCKHNIVANSSFSWWAAWLNQHEEKIVIAPTPWFTDKNLNTKDLFPNNWIEIKHN